jgi:hypothetical protein
VGNLVQDFQLLHRDLVDFVQHVDARDLLSVALDDIDQVVLICIAVEVYVRIQESIFLGDSFDSIIVHLSLRDVVDDGEPSLISPLEVCGKGCAYESWRAVC